MSIKEDAEKFFGSAPFQRLPSRANAVPINPGFGMTGRPPEQPRPYSQPGNFNGNYRGPQSLRGDRAQASLPQRMPPGLLALEGGEGEAPDRSDRNQPPNFIDAVDIDHNWFTPMQPVWPFGPPYVNSPREWDYPVGVNLDYQPRRYAVFQQLRQISESWGILATIIEARIDELLQMPWNWSLKGEKSKKANDKDPRIKMLNEFFKYPDKKHSFEVWMRMILRDRYVIDAAACYIWRAADGSTPYAFEPIDGATIKPLVDDSGRIPDFPSPAYQQIIKGLPMNNYSEYEMIYSPARPRTQLPIYGYSEVEQVCLEAVEGILKTKYQLNFWQEGSMPDMLFGVPEAWTPEQIATWQATWDALLSGNLRQKSQARFIPGGMEPYEVKGSAGELLKCDYDEWLTRIICNAFRMPPTPFIKQLNRSTGKTAKEASHEQGIGVEMVWWTSFMTRLIRLGWGWEDIEYTWEPKPEMDPADQMAVEVGYVKAAIKTVNESRDNLGLDPIPGGDVAMVYIATGAIPLEDLAGGAILDMQQQTQDTAAEAAKNKPQLGAGGPGGGAGGKKPAAKGAGTEAELPLAPGILQTAWSAY